MNNQKKQTDCIGPTPTSILRKRAATYDRVHDRMYDLMPGWFSKMADLMDPSEPELSIQCITDMMCKNPSLNLDDVIHDYFPDWFAYHADGDDDW